MEMRYHRHSLIEWFSQEAIANTKVAVIGAGAVGNEVIKNLALLGVGEIQIFDFDTIEEHNLTRSVLFRDADIGRPKAEVAAQRAIELDSNITAMPVHGDFWDRLSLSSMKAIDVLFCCVDNFEARIRCNVLCYLAGTDFVNIGIDSRSALVEMFPLSRTATAGCLECNLPDTVYSRIAQRYSCGHLRKLSFVEKKIPTTIITSAAAASLAVSLGLRMGSDAGEPEARRIYLATISGSLTRTVLGRAEACPCCGRFEDKPVILSCRPEIDGLPADTAEEATVIVSDPILASYRIAGQDGENIVFKRASEFDSDFPAGVATDPGAVELEIRDQFSLAELSKRFAGRAMPCKFAIVSGANGTFVYEFVGEMP